MIVAFKRVARLHPTLTKEWLSSLLMEALNLPALEWSVIEVPMKLFYALGQVLKGTFSGGVPFYFCYSCSGIGNEMRLRSNSNGARGSKAVTGGNANNASYVASFIMALLDGMPLFFLVVHACVLPTL